MRVGLYGRHVGVKRDPQRLRFNVSRLTKWILVAGAGAVTSAGATPQSQTADIAEPGQRRRPVFPALQTVFPVRWLARSTPPFYVPRVALG